MTVEWEEPAPSRAGNAKVFTADILAALRSRPGEWACIARGRKSGSLVANWRKHHPDYEAVVRTSANGGYDIYARYIGSDGAA